MNRTFVYIDGFNLYYGAIRHNRAHWLDLEAFGKALNGGVPVDRVLYCTAMSRSSKSDPLKAQRQEAYHRALRAACPKVELLFGNFTKHPKPYPITGCPGPTACLARVDVWEEKGSDVNLGARLVHDAHRDLFERAIVITGDSDLAEPVRIVAKELGREVVVVNPRSPDPENRRKQGAGKLQQVATHHTTLSPEILLAAQLPDPVVAGSRSYRKPDEWKKSLSARPDRDKVKCSALGCEVSICRRACE